MQNVAQLPTVLLLILCTLAVVPVAAAQERKGRPPLRRPAPSEQPLRLAELEQLALAGNPTLARAAAAVDAARGRALQAGLYPNPTLAYVAEEIGVEGSAGLQGAMVRQTFVTAGKLGLAQQARLHEVTSAQARAHAQYLRVISGARIRFYDVLGWEKQVQLRRSLAKTAKDLQGTAARLKNTGKISRPQELLVIIQARQAEVDLRAVENRYRAAYRALAAFVGTPHFGGRRVEGDLEERRDPLDREESLSEVLMGSPELAAAGAEVARRRAELDRQLAEPVPNVDVGVGTQYSFETNDQAALVDLGVRLPLFDKNQGNIRAAGAELARADAERRNVELSLRIRHARTFARYLTAHQRVESYRIQLNDATEMYGLYQEAFAIRRVSYEQVLVAQQRYVQLNVDYWRALVDLRQAEASLRGFLLVDELANW